MSDKTTAILAALDGDKTLRSAIIQHLATTHAQEFVNPLRAELGGNDDLSLGAVNSNKEWQE
ncbi:hypothetical protein ACFV2N_35880 [Streptomyces sp. NPDC059680]|uniref:hypothetical protein n=1 Tax=Streptomyces TaxID=1883 RepID=UPI001E2BF687|nr:hypothetical protein [Streptomyces barringtoniae]MCC5478881.1 hypothetical protein [Streptomyces barringtoniae]